MENDHTITKEEYKAITEILTTAGRYISRDFGTYYNEAVRRINCLIDHECNCIVSDSVKTLFIETLVEISFCVLTKEKNTGIKHLIKEEFESAFSEIKDKFMKKLNESK